MSEKPLPPKKQKKCSHCTKRINHFNAQGVKWVWLQFSQEVREDFFHLMDPEMTEEAGEWFPRLCMECFLEGIEYLALGPEGMERELEEEEKQKRIGRRAW